MRFGPIFDPFLVPKQPIFGPKTAHFQGILGFSEDQNGPPQAQKRSKNTCFSVAHGLGSFLRKIIFLPLLDPIDPFGHPPVWA